MLATPEKCLKAPPRRPAVCHLVSQSAQYVRVGVTPPASAALLYRVGGRGHIMADALGAELAPLLLVVAVHAHAADTRHHFQ